MSIPHGEERLALANGIQICYDTFGDPTDPPTLLIMGLGAQMTAWREDFCIDLASKGFWVIRYDNRDSGRSTRFDSAGVPTIGQLLRMAFLGVGRSRVAYKMDDMADDAAGLLNALGVARTHIVGISMGGMIAQSLAIRHPDHVCTLISIMSSPGGARWPLPTAQAMAVLLSPPAKSKEDHIEKSVKASQVLNGRGNPIDEAAVRLRAASGFDRSPKRDGGTARQLAAILASGNREKALRAVRVPTLVIHGLQRSARSACPWRRHCQGHPWRLAADHRWNGAPHPSQPGSTPGRCHCSTRVKQ